MSKANIYGESFYTLAEKEGMADEILSELKSITELFKEHPDYVKILDSPQIEKDELMGILNEDFFGKVNRYTLNFLKLLCEKRMVHHIEECLEEYEKLYNEYNHIKVVSVTTARPMGEKLVEKLVEKLEAKTGGRIVLKKRVDESCIGGIIIETDGKRIDSSIKSELSDLKRTLTD